MPRKVRANKRRVGAEVSDTQRAWLNGEWLLGREPRTQDETMEALALLCDALGRNEALWAAHGNPETHFWKPGLDQPITLSDLEHHEACWLTPDNDNYGGESYFIHTHYSDDAKQKLWGDFGDKELYQWEPVLRRPIPIGASIDAAMVAFTTIGPFNIAQARLGTATGNGPDEFELADLITSYSTTRGA